MTRKINLVKSCDDLPIRYNRSPSTGQVSMIDGSHAIRMCFTVTVKYFHRLKNVRMNVPQCLRVNGNIMSSMTDRSHFCQETNARANALNKN